jgi:DNA-directed RNA polymerase subunit RPC12/RpoP
MVIESCCIIVILVVIVFVVFFLLTNRGGSIQRDSTQEDSPQSDSPSPPPHSYIPTYKCSNCGLNFVQPEEIEKHGSKILVCPECKNEII